MAGGRSGEGYEQRRGKGSGVPRWVWLVAGGFVLPSLVGCCCGGGAVLLFRGDSVHDLM